MSESETLVSLAHLNLPRLYLATFILRAAFGVVTLVLPVFLNDFSKSGRGPAFTGLEIGIIVSAIFISEISLVTIFGRLSDVMQRRIPFIVVGNFIAAISLAMFSFLTNFSGLFFAHLVEGVGAAMMTGPTLALIADSSSEDQIGRKMGIYETMTFGGMAAGFLIGGIFYDLLGGITKNGHWVFALSAILLLITTYISTQMQEPKNRETHRDFWMIKRFYRETVRHDVFMLIAGLIFVVVSLFSGVSLYVQHDFSLITALQGKGVNYQFIAILYPTAAIFLIMGIIDFVLELKATDEERKPIGGEKHNHLHELGAAFKHNQLGKILPAWFLVMAILGTIFTFLPLILSKGIAPGHGDIPAADETLSSGLNTTSIGLFFVIGITVLGSMQIFFGKLVDTWGRRPVLIIGVSSIMILTAEITFVVTKIPKILGDPFGSIAGIIFVITASIIGLGVSAFGPAALAVLADNSTAKNRATSGGIYSVLLGLGNLAGNIFGGVLWDLGDYWNGSQGSATLIFIFCFVLAAVAFYIVVHINGRETE